MNITTIMTAGPVIPVIILDDADNAVRLAEALLEGGIRTAEVTLRTPAGLKAIEQIARGVPDMLVGAGTILTAEQARDVVSAGGCFGVSPGHTDQLVAACRDADLPMLFGAHTVSEMMQLAEYGYREMKFFPASAAGGLGFLKSVHSPLSELSFCPTGGISPDNADEWLALPHVRCVGGSWVTPAELINEGGFKQITALAKQASMLGKSG